MIANADEITKREKENRLPIAYTTAPKLSNPAPVKK